MARRPQPTAQEQASPAPGNSCIEIVKDRASEYATPGIHDGLGGVHYVGDVVEVPREVADVLIGKGFARPADDTSFSAAKARAVEIEDKARQGMHKAAAVSRQSTFDDAPPELRALAREHGDDVIEMWLAGEDAADIVKAYGGKT